MSISTDSAPPPPVHFRATPILDFDSSTLRTLAEALVQPGQSQREYLLAAHEHLQTAIGPIYTVDELQPASVTLGKRKGSCTQRMACLEALSRAHGIATRVRALWIAGRFWHPRFYFTRPFIPRRILLSWPQFYLAGEWVDFSEIYHPLTTLAQTTTATFTNADETLFDAVARTPVDFLGKIRQCGGTCGPGVDLSRFLEADGGFFDSRDELFAQLGSFQHTLRGRGFELIFGGRKSR